MSQGSVNENAARHPHYMQGNPAVGSPSVSPSAPEPSTAGVAGQPLFKCSRCSRTYTRSDHLTRHFRSHTQEKPFACPVCNKSFARADLLKRHALNHSESADQPASKRICTQLSSIISSKRAAQACKACAAAKVRCDGTQPCQRCVKKAAPCEYNNVERRPRAPPTSGAATDVAPRVAVPDEQRIGSYVSARPEGLSMKIMNVLSPQTLPPTPVTTDPTVEEFRNPEPARNHFLSLDNDNAHYSNYQDISPYANSFAHFLRDVIIPKYPAHATTAANLDKCPTWNSNIGEEPADLRDAGDAFADGNYATRDLLEFDAGSLELNEFDFGLIESFSRGLSPIPEAITEPLPAPDASTSTSSQPQPASIFSNDEPRSNSHPEAPVSRIEAFQQSLWVWKPQSNDSHKDCAEISQCIDRISSPNPHTAQSTELQLVSRIQNHSFRSPPRCPRVPSLELAGRDKIYLMVVRSYDFWSNSKFPSSFPSVQFLDALVELFFNHQGVTSLRFLHWNMFKPGAETRAEFLGAVVMAGAVLAPVGSVRKFGYGLQESVRKSILNQVEGNNTLTRNLQVVQALYMVLYVGVWSGGKRKSEIADSCRQSLITMLRRAGRFRSFQYATIIPSADDNAEVLNRKWNTWLELEAWKRLVYHTFILESQICTTFQVPPLISYAELTLPLPYSSGLWSAPSAEAWRKDYLVSPPPHRLPSFVEYFRNFQAHPLNPGICWRLSLFTVLHGISFLIFEYRQIFAVRTAIPIVERDGLPCGRVTSDLILTSRMQELSGMLGNWRVKAVTIFHISDQSAETGTLEMERLLTFSLLQLSLHTCLDNLQIFAGKEGETSARNIYPSLQRWRSHDNSRRALWHAGQLIRVFRNNVRTYFTSDFAAVAVYHASLVLWAYGLLSLSDTKTPSRNSSSPRDVELVQVDCEEDSIPAQRFVALGIGKPVILGDGGKIIPLDAPQDVMDTLAGLLCWEEEPTPLVESLVKLMRDLGSAAFAVGMM